MLHEGLIKNLSRIDDLENWSVHLINIDSKDKKWIYEFAERKWIERKLKDGTLLVHPLIREQLISREFKPLSIHRKMIWASVLVSYDGPNSKIRFDRIKEKIIKKHSNRWGFDVYKRIKPTYATRQRLLKQQNETSPALQYATTHSSFFAQMANEERDEALKMIPKD